MDEKQLYDRQHGEGKLISRSSFPLLRRVFRRLDLRRDDLAVSFLDGGGALLDVGGGGGELLIKAYGKYGRLYGIDVSETRIKQARERTASLSGRDKPVFSVCNTNGGLDFPDASLDAVTSIAVLEHVFDLYFVVSEINRVLKKGGVFVAQVPNIAYIKQRVTLLLGILPVTSSPYNWIEIGWDGGHLHYFTKKTFCGLLEDGGFKIEKVSGTGLFAGLRNFYPALLTGDICVKAVKK